ncbi:phenylalanine--tRNA ligase subunit beta [Alteribacter natronophilus]|uniref:phenylalanine--tRNA ligase subunit beta n=1 Tax=Alteribacter natronophilus TaxID=2583810 RepID=UPI00110E8D76|nr:phenylalanine--tRNA ligase subunit beta [Alteribacter natronophilus]TMW71660.1 phenylalanine--tRNA ligase subunit beta [Alteribacter natronophilus]
MLISYNWLREYLNIDDYTPAQIAEKLTRSGVEVDILHELNKGIKGVVVGHVLECEQHPDADKLKVCQVDVGEVEPVQIVCGAKNVGKGQFVPVAKVGARLPGDFKIKKAKLRGQVSQGMICSLQELGYEGKLVSKSYAEGIFVFPHEVTPGEDALEELNLNDTVLELDLTPNRSDCLSMIGTAYEVGAILNREPKLPAPRVHTSGEKASDLVSVQVDSSEDTPYYGATIIRNLEIKESPLWLQNRLMAAGIRPISNVVDITNYVLLEYGQPLHAFDYDRLGSQEILVRRAKSGEKMVTLDDQERVLSEDHLVITNGEVPVALAGVMGGADSEVHEGTTAVLLEAAVFNGSVIRRAVKDTGLRSDASTRFEKGVDASRVKEAARRAASLMAELAGGTIAEGVEEADNRDTGKLEVELSLERLNRKLGTSLSDETVSDILHRLDFPLTKTSRGFNVAVPMRRPDLSIEVDLIEEVARLYGYDNIPTTLPDSVTTPGGLTKRQVLKRRSRRYLESAGLNEAITYALTTGEKEASVRPAHLEHEVKLALPMSEDRSTLRTTLIPHLLEALSHNRKRSIYDAALFELSAVFHTSVADLQFQPEEKLNLAGALMGTWQEHPWQQEKKQVDFYVAKGLVEGLAKELDTEGALEFEQAEIKGMHPGRGARVMVDGRYAGFVAQVHPAVAKDWSLKEVYVFELDFDVLTENTKGDVRYEPIPRFPSIDRDIALVVDEKVSAGQLEAVIREEGGHLLRDVKLFDLYEGENLEEGRKSIAFSLRYLDPERTLTDEDVTRVHNRVVEALEEKLGAALRS